MIDQRALLIGYIIAVMHKDYPGTSLDVYYRALQIACKGFNIEAPTRDEYEKLESFLEYVDNMAARLSKKC